MASAVKRTVLAEHRAAGGAPWSERVRRAATLPVSSASLAAFRIAFGVAMIVNTLLYMPVLARKYDIDPEFHFTYPGFDFVRPPPGYGLYLVYALMLVAGALIAAGWMYRRAASSFFVLTTYVFLLDSTYYQNHEYLISLLALMLALLPANCRWSLDARHQPERRSATVPAWMVWLLRFQIGVPYFYGGIAKLNSDWLRGEPLRRWLADRTDLEPIKTVVTTDWVVWTMTYGALLLDLTVVWFLLNRRTRPAAFVVATCFHLMNAWLFGLFIFPWLMIAATTIFFAPDWPQRLAYHPLVRAFRGEVPELIQVPASPAERRRASPLLVGFFAAWVVLQLVVPLRHYAIGTAPSWTEEGHRFSWHMKLRDKEGTATFVVTTQDRTLLVDPRDLLRGEQASRLAGHPERLAQFAHHLSDLYDGAEVRVRTSVSLNGREPQPIVDPSVNLALVSPVWWRSTPWILPLDTPLRT